MTNHYLKDRSAFWTEVEDEFGPEVIVIHMVRGNFKASSELPESEVLQTLKRLVDEADPKPKPPTPRTTKAPRTPKARTARPTRGRTIAPTAPPGSTEKSPKAGQAVIPHDMLAWARATGRTKKNSSYVKAADRAAYPGRGNWNKSTPTNGTGTPTVLRPFVTANAG